MAPAAPPKVMLWAWERPGDLRALPAGAGVAFLAATVTLIDGEVETMPRFQPLRLPRGAYRMAVVRVAAPGAVSEATQLRPAVDAIADVAATARADALQIDFDAGASQLPFYRALLGQVRARLGKGLFLSMTALVSWCGADSWMRGLPVNEIVPMTFEMGGAAPAIEARLRSGGKLESPLCRASIGVAEQDLAARPRALRTYVFAYRDWTEEAVRAVLERTR